MVRDELGSALLERSKESTIFLSSHDLAEIEGFATHLAYLDSGRLRLSEEMSFLNARFREVEITFDAPAAIPPSLPANWIQVTAADQTVRFVDESFDQKTADAAITQYFGPVRSVTFTPMTLRSIFLALAKTSRRTS
jgi:ABC-2 type transport system ATP-binding protein